MTHDYAQRRRVAVAAAITVIAAPAAFLLGGGDDAEPVETPSVITEAPTATGPRPAVPAPDETDPLGSSPVAYLEGTAPAADDDGAMIAIPRPQQAFRGIATFRRDIHSVTECQASGPGVPFNAEITVTNLDNSRSVQCISSIRGYEGAVEDVVLHEDAFLQIADLTDAPIPVQVTW